MNRRHKISQEEKEHLEMFNDTLTWLTDERKRITRLINKQIDVRQHRRQLKEIRARCNQLSRDVSRYMKRFKGSGGNS